MKTIIAVLIGICLSLPQSFAAERQLLNQVLAVVNDDVITQSEFDMVFRPIYEQIKKAAEGSEFAAQLNDLRLKLLNQMIEDKLVYQEAVQLGIEVEDSAVEEQFQGFKKQFPDEATFQQELAASGVTMDALKQQFRERIAITRLHQYMIRSKVVVAPSDVEKYFQDNPDEFLKKRQIELWSITIPKSEEAIQKGEQLKKA